MPDRLSDQKQRGEEQQHERDSPMESAELRFEPRIHMPLQEASVVGIGAVVLQRACVAGVCRRTIVHDTALVICFGAQQLPVRGTFPEIQFLEVHKPGIPGAF